MNEMNDEPILAKVDFVSRILQISKSKTYELINEGVIPHVRIGGMIRVPMWAVRKLAEQHQEREGDLSNEAA